MKPAWRSLSLIRKSFQKLCRQLLEFLRFGKEVILYALIFISAFFLNRASLGCDTYLFRDNDAIYGDEVGRFLKGTGIEEARTAFRSPWQNPFVKRHVGILRRELLDHVLVLNEKHLTRWLKEFIEEYCHIARLH